MSRFEDISERIPTRISGKMQFGIIAAIGIALSAICGPAMVQEVYQDEIVAIQAPFTGTITWHTKPGWAYQGFGTVIEYKKRYTLEFKKQITNGKETGGLQIRFADGGHATIYGSVQFKMPEDEKNLNSILSGYRGTDAVKENLLRTVLNKSIYLSGTLMTTKESYSEKRNDLIHYVTDQMQNGVYKTRQTSKWIKDEITQQNKEITQAEILVDKQGKVERQEESVLDIYHITAFNFAPDEMPYDTIVEQQIRQQQQITMDVQTSIANAKKKDQDALTAEAEGRRSIAEAKAKAETEKTTATVAALREKEVAVTNANKEKEVAETAAARDLKVAEVAKQAAEQYKLRLILEGQGEAEKKKLILEADGALQQKLATYEKVAQTWATALMNFKGDIVPHVVMGQQPGQTGTSNAVNDFMNLQNIKAATDLGLNLDMTNKKK